MADEKALSLASDQTANPTTDPKIARLEQLMDLVRAGKMTAFEYQKEVEALNNPASEVFPSTEGLR